MEENKELKRLRRDNKKMMAEIKWDKRRLDNLQKRCSKLEGFCQRILDMSVINTKVKGKRCRNMFSADDWKFGTDEVLPFLSGREDIHDEVLRENLPLMVDDMEIGRTFLLDELVEDSCLTSEEGAKIRYLNDRKDQTRKLASILSKRSAKVFSIFVKRMASENNYPHVADALKASYNEKTTKYHQARNHSNRNKDCLICTLVKRVKIKDIIDILLQNHIVDWEVFDRLKINGDSGEDWEFVFESIDFSDNRAEKLECLKNALGKKHKEVQALMNQTFPRQLTCYCGKISHRETLGADSTLPSYSNEVSSAGYVNTTSEEIARNLNQHSTETSDSHQNLSLDDERLHKGQKMCKEGGHNSICIWLDRADHSYDKEYPDIPQDMSSPVGAIIALGNDTKDNNSNTTNLEEVAVCFVSKHDQGKVTFKTKELTEVGETKEPTKEGETKTLKSNLYPGKGKHSKKNQNQRKCKENFTSSIGNQETVFKSKVTEKTSNGETEIGACLETRSNELSNWTKNQRVVSVSENQENATSKKGDVLFKLLEFNMSGKTSSLDLNDIKLDMQFGAVGGKMTSSSEDASKKSKAPKPKTAQRRHKHKNRKKKF